MGNHLLKNNKPPKESRDGVVLRNKHNKRNGDFKAQRDKHQSCPEFGDGGAIPYKETTYSVGSVHDVSIDVTDASPKVEIKIYRSYGDLDRYRQELVRDQSNPDIRVYKRSSTSIAGMSSTASLPKDFGARGMTKQQKKRLLNGDVGSSPAHAQTGTAGDDEPVEEGRVSNEQKLSPQHRSAPNISAQKPHSSKFRFPRTTEVKRKLKVFEDRFRKSLAFKFLTLDESRLLDTLCLARDLGNQGAEVSVHAFLQGHGVPEHLTEEQFVLMVPAAVYRLLHHIRQDGVTDSKLWRSLARDILVAIGEEVSRELGRMYEYQITMLQEDVSVQLLAVHAVDCIMEYIIRKRAMLHRNAALRAVVTMRPRHTASVPVRFSVVLGDREQKWDLFEIFKKPGVRKDIYYQDSAGLALGVDSPFPWRFFTTDTSDCEPLVYGFRGQMLEHDCINEVYRMYPEEKLYADEITFNRTDFHMHFIPYRILVNVEIMREYLDHIVSAELPNRPNVSLTDFYKHMIPYTGDDRQQQMCYRPLSQLGPNYTWHGAVLENMDLTRVNLSEHPGECQSLHGSTLLFSDCREATVANTDVEGCDFSYAVIGGRTQLPVNKSPPGAGAVMQMVLVEDKARQVELIMDDVGNGRLPAQVISARMKSLTDISPEKDSFSSLDYNFNMAAPKSTPRDDQGAKRRFCSSSTGGTGSRQHRPKQRRVQSCVTSGLSYRPPAVPEAQSTPSHSQGGSSQSQSPCRSVDAMTLSSDALERGEIQYADAAPSYLEQHTRRAALPVLMFPPPPAYSPDHQSQLSSASPASSFSPSASVHQMSIESQVEAIMTSPVSTQPPASRRSGQAVGTVQLLPISSLKVPARSFKKPKRKRASLNTVEESPGAAMMAKMIFDQSPLYGRNEETADISEAIVMNTRLVTITGCPGLGKSAVAVAVAKRLHDAHNILPVFVDLRGCLTADQVRAQIVRSLGLKLTRRYFDLVGHWLGSHNRKLILVLDNLDLPLAELGGFADLLPSLLSSNKLFILCTSRRAIYGGDFGVTDYKLGDIEEASCDLLRDMVPDLPDTCVQELAGVCGYVPYTVSLVASALKHPDVSAHQLYMSLVSGMQNNSISQATKEHLKGICAYDDLPLVCRLFSVVEAVVQQMPTEVQKLLTCLSLFQVPFDQQAAKAVLTDTNLESRLPDFPYSACTCYGGLLDKDPTGELLIVPSLVKAVMQAQTIKGSNSNSSSVQFKYYTYYINKITHLCQCYHSKDYGHGLGETWRDYQNILDALTKAMYDSRALYESCARLATPDMCIFLYEALEESDYSDLYKCLMDVTKQWVDCNVDRCVLSCFAYFQLRSENFSEASLLVDEAMELFPKPSPSSGGLTEENVFAVMLGLYRGVLDWRMEYDDDDDEAKAVREDSVEKVRCALESLKQTVGLQHALTIYAYETYAMIEKERGNYQKSRHFYNMLDFVGENTLGRHPALLDGYDARRAIWERQGLFCRATDVAQKAAEVAMAYHGEHPFTAELHMKWVDCLLKVGDIAEATRAADIALCMRERLFGDHIETVLTHKMVAYLNLRCGLYDDAVKHGLRALEMSRRLHVHSVYLTDIETILTQAQRHKEAGDTTIDSGVGRDINHVHKAQVHDSGNKNQSLHLPNHRPQKPLRTLSTSACRREATPALHQAVRASLSTAV